MAALAGCHGGHPVLIRRLELGILAAHTPILGEVLVAMQSSRDEGPGLHHGGGAPPTYGPVESPKAWSARRPGARPSIARAVVQPKLGGRCLFAHATWYVHLQLCRGLRRQAVEMPCCRQRWPVLQERATDYTHRDCHFPRLFSHHEALTQTREGAAKKTRTQAIKLHQRVETIGVFHFGPAGRAGRGDCETATGSRSSPARKVLSLFSRPGRDPCPCGGSAPWEPPRDHCGSSALAGMTRCWNSSRLGEVATRKYMLPALAMNARTGMDA